MWDRLGAPGELFDEPFRNRRSQQRVACGDDADGFDQILRRRGLEEERGGTGGECVEDVFVQLEGGEDHHARQACDLARGRDAVEARHADVHQDDVGALFADEVDRLLAVRRLARDLHVGLRLHDHAEACAHQRLVVGDDDADQLLRGSLARTVKPPSDDDPVFISPPKSSTLSCMPIRP